MNYELLTPHHTEGRINTKGEKIILNLGETSIIK